MKSKQSELLPPEQPKASQPTVVFMASHPPQERLNSADWFARSFASASGVLVAVLVVLVVVPALFCGGLILLGIMGDAVALNSNSKPPRSKIPRPSNQTGLPPKPELLDPKIGSTNESENQTAPSMIPMELAVVDVRVAKPSVNDLGGYTLSAEEPELIVTLQITNKDAQQTIICRNNSEAGISAFHLYDEQGGELKQVEYGPGTSIDGSIAGKSIAPNTKADHVLAFSIPKANASFVTLSVDRSFFGSSGTEELRISMANILILR